MKDVTKLYKSFEINKKNDGVRKLNAPLEELKDIQRKLAQALYKQKRKQKKENHISHAFEKNKSIITNAKIHRNKRMVLNIDLEKFFESIHFGRVRGLFIKNNNFLLPTEVATVIAQITCMKENYLKDLLVPQSFRILICEILDYRISKIAKRYKLEYTRYANDLTFSANDKKFLGLQTYSLKKYLKR